MAIELGETELSAFASHDGPRNVEGVQKESQNPLLEALQRYWGYGSFRPLQEEAMQCGLLGQDSVVILPTGGGKSLCFQAPAVCMPGLTIVVSPLISLMKDQVDTLRECGIAAAQLNSTLTMNEKKLLAEQIDRRELKLLYIAPERLAMEKTLSYLQTANVSMIAIDEAHCISAWGHDFRPEYRMLGRLKDCFPGVGVHAYTATASEKVRSDIAVQLRLNRPTWIVGNFDRPNLTYRVLECDNRFRQVVEVVNQHKGESGIVYCISRKEVEKYASGLGGLGLRALPYHAGLTDLERKSNQEAFLQDRCDIIVATVAFGMGIDKPDVRYVVHAASPKSLEHYQQESGRAGRDGLEAECTLIYSQGDFITWSKIIDNTFAESGNEESREGQYRSLDSIRGYCGSVQCRHKELVEFFGQVYQGDNCGACDVCLGEVELVEDPLRIGQMILSCVMRLRERYGADYTAKVLIGASDERVKQQGHDQLSTYGLLREQSHAMVREWIDQLISQGFLKKSLDKYSILQVTDLGKQLLKGQQSPRLSKASEGTKARRREATPAASWEGVDRGLFDHLKGVRSTISAEKAIPAFAVFSDATLRGLAGLRPSSLDRMKEVQGVGMRKLEELGDRFLGEIDSYCRTHGLSRDEALPVCEPSRSDAPLRPKGLSASSIAAIPYFREGCSIEKVCSEMNRARSTVVGYLYDYCVSQGVTEVDTWVPASEISQIEQAIDVVGDKKLGPIFDHLESQVPYDSIRIVAAAYANRRAKSEAK